MCVCVHVIGSRLGGAMPSTSCELNSGAGCLCVCVCVCVGVVVAFIFLFLLMVTRQKSERLQLCLGIQECTQWNVEKHWCVCVCVCVCSDARAEW